MGLFKSKNEKSENENDERSDSVSKKDKAEESQVAENQEAPASEAANEGVLSNDDQQALVKFQSQLPEHVFENIQHLVSIMNPDKKGFEEMGGARWSAPVVRIRQAMTSEAPETAKNGDIYTDLGDVFERLEFTPLYMYKTRAMFEDDNPNPACRSENGVVNIYGNPCKECPHYQFKKGERQACAESINVLAFNKDMDQIYHLQFARTSFRAGFKLFRQASATARMWDRWYALQTEERTRQGSSKTKYYVFTVTPTGEKVDPNLYGAMKLFNEKITAARKNVLAKVEEGTANAKQLVSKLDESAFEGAGDGDGGDAPEPDFSTNKSM